jgi:hypothetical protein
MLADLPKISFFNFFKLQVDGKFLNNKKDDLISKNHLLPSSCKFLDEQEFAKVYFGWNLEGIYLNFEIDLLEIEFLKDDFIDVFIDTKDLKTKGYLSKYCHHFVFHPIREEKKENTKFRSDDMHKLCDDKDLSMLVKKLDEKKYLMEIFIPSFCMYGYDPKNYQKISFSYRIRNGLYYQHFYVTSSEYTIQKNPSLWTTLNLVK